VKRVEVKSRPPAPSETNDGDDIARLVMERHNAASRATYCFFFLHVSSLASSFSFYFAIFVITQYLVAN